MSNKNIETLAILIVCVFFIIIAISVSFFIHGGIIFLAWNWVLVPTFGWKSLTFMQAGILGILFGTLMAPFVSNKNKN